MRIGLFGGTFDPVHIGHLVIAETVGSDTPLDRVLFIPAFIPPHKLNEKTTPASIRIEMLKAATIDNPRFDVSEYEIRKEGVSYTIDTVRYFMESEKWREHDFCMIIGEDSLAELESWKDPDALAAVIPIFVVRRPGSPPDSDRNRFRERVTFVRSPRLEISSQEIRDRVRLGMSIKYWVPHAVESIIREKGLYR